MEAGKFSKLPLEKWLHPNSLTLYRVGAVPALVVLLLFENRACAFFAAIVFSIAAITDYVDGHVARKYGLVSNVGKFLDPLADKLLTSTALIMLASLGRVPGWIVCVIVGREIAVTGLRSIAAEKGIVIAASQKGKWKMGLQIGAVIPLLLHFRYFGVDLHLAGMVVLYMALVATVVSGIDYFMVFFRLARE
jgi:CDP-diacylglycerol--glycerol-3-phosphate 3-phosphatidyltransferase